MFETDDAEIIALYFRRNERAITETALKYGKNCHGIAYRILENAEDADECTNDTWMRTWNAIPPDEPQNFLAYLIVIVRRLAIDRFRSLGRSKRGSNQTTVVLDELAECISDNTSVEQETEHRLLRERIQAFLRSLPKEQRVMFVQRYTYMLSVKEIAKQNGFSESKVKVTLLRVRNTLREMLEQEGLL